MILLLDIEQMAAILKVLPTMSKIFSDNTTMYGIPENPIIDTKNTNLSLFCRK